MRRRVTRGCRYWRPISNGKAEPQDRRQKDQTTSKCQMFHVKRWSRRFGVGSNSQREVEIPCLEKADVTIALAATMLSRAHAVVDDVYQDLREPVVFECQSCPSHYTQKLGQPTRASVFVAHGKMWYTKRSIPSRTAGEKLTKGKRLDWKNASKGDGKVCDVARCSDVRTDRPGFKS